MTISKNKLEELKKESEDLDLEAAELKGALKVLFNLG